MSDEPTKTSHPAGEKEPTRKAGEDKDPKRHGSGEGEGSQGSEAGGGPGEGRTGTGLGSTDS